MKMRGRRGHGGPTAHLPSPAVFLLGSLLWVMVVMVMPVCGAHQILWGRCYSYCIQQHLLQPVSSVEEADPESMPRNPIHACQRHQTCRWCLYVCERPEKSFTNSTSCLRDCRYTRTRSRSGGRQACTEACGFVGRASSARGGTCPAPHSLHGFQSACVTSCHSDRDCSRAEEKCCSNDCGTVCTAPYDVHILPPVPRNISFKMLKTGGVKVKWRLGEDTPEESGSSSSKTGTLWAGSPVVYILRWWCPYTSGAVTSVTDRPRTKLQGYPTGIYPGSKCHFMVAAVNLRGSRGFSKVSPYIKKFLNPSAPLHLDQVRTRLHNDGKVDVTIQWQPPVYTDGLPVFKYQVFWSDHLPQASPSYIRLHMHRRVLDADRSTFVLESLRPGTLYFVQVRAVVKWKGRQKRGDLASTYIETYSPPQPRPSDGKEDEGGGGIEADDDSESGIIHSVKVNQTFFHDTVLKAAITWTLKPDKSARKYLIYWRAETCSRSDHRKLHRRLETSATSHERRFTLYNLRPECEYAVRVHPVNRRGRTGAATVTNFLTPPCHLIEVRQGEPPVCQTAEPPGQVQGLHSETSRCITVIRWEPPSSSGADDDVIESYDVMWGETEAGVFSTATIIYTSAPRELSVPANTSHVQLGQLTAGQHYTIQVRATSAGGSSPPAILHLKIPAPDRPCASEGAEGPKEGIIHPPNRTMTSLHEEVIDIQNITAHVSKSESAGSSLASHERQKPSDGTTDVTRNVSVELDVVSDLYGSRGHGESETDGDDDEGGEDSMRVEGGDGGGDSVGEDGRGKGEKDGDSAPKTASSTNPSVPSITKDSASGGVDSSEEGQTGQRPSVTGSEGDSGQGVVAAAGDHGAVNTQTDTSSNDTFGTPAVTLVSGHSTPTSVDGPSRAYSDISNTTTTTASAVITSSVEEPQVTGSGVALRASSLWTLLLLCCSIMLCVFS